MKEKIIKLNKFVDNVCGSCCFLFATGAGFFGPSLLAVFITANDFGTALFEASSTWVPSESSYKKQTTSLRESLSLRSQPAPRDHFFSKKKKNCLFTKTSFVKKLAPEELVSSEPACSSRLEIILPHLKKY